MCMDCIVVCVMYVKQFASEEWREASFFIQILYILIVCLHSNRDDQPSVICYSFVVSGTGKVLLLTGQQPKSENLCQGLRHFWIWIKLSICR